MMPVAHKPGHAGSAGRPDHGTFCVPPASTAIPSAGQRRPVARHPENDAARLTWLWGMAPPMPRDGPSRCPAWPIAAGGRPG